MMTVVTSQKQGTAPDQSEYALSPNVVLLLSQDGTARLLDMGGKFYALPATGAQMLKGTLEQGASATVTRLADQYGVSSGQVQADLNTLLDNLEQRGLIHGLRRRRRVGQPGAGWPSLFLIPALRFIYLSRRSLEARAAALLTLARLSFFLFGWARTIAAWKRCLRQVDLQFSEESEESEEPEEQEEETVKAIDEAVRKVAAKHVLRMACKERALCCWYMLRCMGVPADLVVGVNLFPLAGHCWCEVGPRMLSDYRDRCEAYTPVVRYG